MGSSRQDQIWTFWQGSHFWGLEMTFWDDVLMTLHGFGLGNSKQILTHPKVVHFDTTLNFQKKIKYPLLILL